MTDGPRQGGRIPAEDGDGPEPWPDFFIVGAPKSGTTSMQTYLASHPDVFVAPGEPGYLLSGLEPPPGYEREETAYLDRFRDAGDALRVGEKAVWYLVSEKTADRIHQVVPNADIIVMLRDPVEMTHSLHGQMIKDGNENIRDFGEAVRAAGARKQGHRLPRRAFTPSGLVYTEVARYDEQVGRYVDVFGRESVHVVLFDEFVEDTAAEYRRTLRFLGVDPGHRPDFEARNVHDDVRMYPLYRFLVNPPNWLKRTVLRVLPKERAKAWARAVRSRFRTERGRPPMDPDARRLLVEAYRPHIENLEELIDRDLGHWCRPAAKTRGSIEERAPGRGGT